MTPSRKIRAAAVSFLNARPLTAGLDASTRIELTLAEPSRCASLLESGEVDLAVGGTVVETVGPGGIFGEMALIEHEARSATAIAKTPCELVPIDERRFSFMVQQTPNFAMHVLRTLAHRLRAMNAR